MILPSLPHQSTVEQLPTDIRTLNNAADLLITKGYAETSFTDIIYACSLSELHNHTYGSSKEAIVSALIQAIQADCEQKLFAPLSQTEKSQVQRCNDFLVAFKQFLDNQAYCVLPSILAAEPGLGSVIQIYWQAWQQAFAQLLQPYQPKDKVDELAQHLVVQMQGALLFSVRMLDKDYITPVYQQVETLTQEGSCAVPQHQQLRQQQKMMQTLASSMAHELRTPLTAIKLNAPRLAKVLPALIDGYQQAQQAKLAIKPLPRTVNINNLDISVARIKQSTNEAESMIQMMLDMLQATSKQQNGCHDLEDFTISTCISEAIEQYPFESSEQKAQVHWRVNGADFQVHGNSLLLKHVLFNLLHNALEIIETEGKGDITIWLNNKDGISTLHVKDTAKGLTPEAQDALFSQFYSKRKGGTGIGLAFCQLIMQSWHGDIQCHAVEGEYTEFVLSFPH